MKTVLPESTGKGAYLPPQSEVIQTMSVIDPICTSNLNNSTEEWEEVDLSMF
jgi:hypothetical protein